jgi:signal transduction histidine kinase
MSESQIRVLLVEDDLVDRMACRRAIAHETDSDFALLEAATGREGLLLAAEQGPHCILLDYNLPDMNGLEFLAELIGSADRTPMPVMLLTGGDSASVAAAAIKHGAWDYLGKDIDRQYLEMLPMAIRRMLRERRLDEGKRQTEQALRQSQAELRELAGHLERMKEAERKRIAQEIHDELGGLLTGIKAYVSVYLERAERAGTPPDQLLIDAMTLADNGFQAVRRVITDLRPSVLDQLGVWAALEWYTEQIGKRSGLQCTCMIAPDVAALELGADLSTMLFRVVQEALTNAARHAQASQVSVLARLDGDALIVEVRDNGSGIDTSRRPKGESWGIVGMGERVRYFGGELTITGKPGARTSVALRLPMEKINGD